MFSFPKWVGGVAQSDRNLDMTNEMSSLADVSLFDENQIQYFLIGPTLQRLVGGSTGLSVSDHLDLQYSLSLQIGIWNTNTTMARVVKLMKSLRYELEVEINKYHGLPGDYIFLNKGDTSFAKLLFLSLFHRSRTYIWQGRPESTRLGYNFFDTTFINYPRSPRFARIVKFFKASIDSSSFVSN